MAARGPSRRASCSEAGVGGSSGLAPPQATLSRSMPCNRAGRRRRRSSPASLALGRRLLLHPEPAAAQGVGGLHADARQGAGPISTMMAPGLAACCFGPAWGSLLPDLHPAQGTARRTAIPPSPRAPQSAARPATRRRIPDAVQKRLPLRCVRHRVLRARRQRVHGHAPPHDRWIEAAAERVGPTAGPRSARSARREDQGRHRPDAERRVHAARLPVRAVPLLRPASQQTGALHSA